MAASNHEHSSGFKPGKWTKQNKNGKFQINIGKIGTLSTILQIIEVVINVISSEGVKRVEVNRAHWTHFSRAILSSN